MNTNTQVQANMNIVLEVIRQIMDKDGNFEFESLASASGLDRVVVRQTIVFLNQSGNTIIKMRADPTYWQWQDVKWSRRDLAKASR